MTEKAAPTAELAFEDLAVRHRVELLAHCYRMLGSPEDAEDAVQETYLRAFRSRHTWEGRSSMRTWLYKIATNVCLDARRAAAHRPLPSGLCEPTSPVFLGAEDAEVLWLEPIPDSALFDDRADPASQVAARAGMRLAFVAALQHLSPVQRAVLVLRDVLAWQAAEVAEILDLSVPSVNNHLQRARRRLKQTAPHLERAPTSEDPALSARAEDYAHTFLRADIGGLVGLLHEDVALEMPPIPTWLRGRSDVAAFLGTRLQEGPWRALATAANTQRALAFYRHETGPGWRPESLHVLDIDGADVRGVIVFRDPQVFTDFDLPDPLSDHPHNQEITP